MYIELHTSSAFSFLDGASSPEALITRAAELGYPALALLDRDGVYGAPQFYRAAKAAGLKAIVGAELTIGPSGTTSEPGTPEPRNPRTPEPRNPGTPEPRNPRTPTWTLPLLVSSAEGYRNLCRVITRGKLRAAKGEASFTFEDFTGHTTGLIAL